MPTIPVNLGTVVSAFEDLPIGTYLAEIAKIKYREPTQTGKFPQLMVSYLVIDGDHTGRKQTQWLSLSPNALGFVKDFFAKFGLGDIPNLVIDDETEELNDPDLYGAQVIFKNAVDKKDAERIRTSLVSVESWEGNPDAGPVSVVKPKPAPASPTATVGRLANQVEADIEAVTEEDPAAAKAAAKAARIAAAQAALEAAAAEDDDDDEPEPVVKPAPRTAAPRAAAADKPVRRTLR